MNDREIIEKLVSISERSIEATGKIKGILDLLRRDIEALIKGEDTTSADISKIAETLTNLELSLKDELSEIKSNLKDVNLVAGQVKETIGKIENREETSKRIIALWVTGVGIFGAIIGFLIQVTVKLLGK